MNQFVRYCKRVLKDDTFNGVILILFLLLAFILPVYKKPVSVITGVLFIALLFQTFRKNSFKQIRTSIIHWGWIVLYLLFAIGLSYTENTAAGFFDLEVKLSFLVFPLIFAMASPFFNHEFKNHVQKIFVAGVLVGSAICMARSSYHYISGSHEINEFFYTKLSPHFHPSYLAMYLNVAIIIVAQMLSRKLRQARTGPVLLLSGIIVFCLIMVFLLNSKAGIIITFLSLFAFLIYRLFSGMNKAAAIGSVLAVIALSFVTWHTIPGLKNRFVISVNSLKTYSGKTINPEEGTQQRILIWKYSISAICEKPITGVGTGDVHQELDKRYLTGHFTHGAEKHLNAHNQFLQTALAIGIPGLICLLYILIALVVTGIKKRDPVIVFLVLILFLNFLVESMLETQAGTVFTVFFVSFFAMKETNVGNEVSVRKD